MSLHNKEKTKAAVTTPSARDGTDARRLKAIAIAAAETISQLIVSDESARTAVIEWRRAGTIHKDITTRLRDGLPTEMADSVRERVDSADATVVQTAVRRALQLLLGQEEEDISRRNRSMNGRAHIPKVTPEQRLKGTLKRNEIHGLPTGGHVFGDEDRRRAREARGTPWDGPETARLLQLIRDGHSYSEAAAVLNDEFHGGAHVRNKGQANGRQRYLKRSGQLDTMLEQGAMAEEPVLATVA